MSDLTANDYPLNEKASIILLDIEGTTTAINFVKDVLFVKAKEEVENFLERNFENDEIQEILEKFIQQVDADVEDGIDGSTKVPRDADRSEKIATIVSNVRAMIEADRKVGSLKALQGMIWREAYQSGVFKGHVYEDVLPALEAWRKMGKKICIYSSGSINAQKLLFKHSENGNLLKFLEGHFDTGIGLKTEARSYKAIAKALKKDNSDILFVTDLEKEAYAARDAGTNVIISVRPGTQPLSSDARRDFLKVSSFAEITPLLISIKDAETEQMCRKKLKATHK